LGHSGLSNAASVKGGRQNSKFCQGKGKSSLVHQKEEGGGKGSGIGGLGIVVVGKKMCQVKWGIRSRCSFWGSSKVGGEGSFGKCIFRDKYV